MLIKKQKQHILLMVKLKNKSLKMERKDKNERRN